MNSHDARLRLHMTCRQRLQEMLGAHFEWLFDAYEGCFTWMMLYWPAADARRMTSQVFSIGLFGCFSGFRSWSRGLSWDRRSRYGIR